MNLREQMPNTAAFIDDMRAVFGAEMVDQQIRRAMHGQPTFYAEENGHSFGTKMPDRGKWVTPHVAYRPKPQQEKLTRRGK